MQLIRKTLLLTVILFFSLSFIAFAGPVPDTGQTQSHTDTFGEDSDYDINTQSYIKLNSNGYDLTADAALWAMVRDNVTGLIWEVKSDDGSIHDRDNTYNWYEAQSVFINALNNANFGGFNDWRMPTIKELSFIVNSGRTSVPAINTNYFPKTRGAGYWSSTTYVNSDDYAWRVYFGYGGVGHNDKTHTCYVRAVSSGQ